VSESEDFLERFPELRIEDGVDHRVDAAVHVAEPGVDFMNQFPPKFMTKDLSG
jgi:hypothetical protein